MKLILFEIFLIIDFNLILPKYLNSSDIFKGGKSRKNLNSKNKTEPINTKNDSSQDEIVYEVVDTVIIEEESVSENRTDYGPPIDEQSNDWDNTDEKLKKRIIFIECCLKGGLISDEQILNAYDWALENIGFFFFKFFFLKLGYKILRSNFKVYF